MCLAWMASVVEELHLSDRYAGHAGLADLRECVCLVCMVAAALLYPFRDGMMTVGMMVM